MAGRALAGRPWPGGGGGGRSAGDAGLGDDLDLRRRHDGRHDEVAVDHRLDVLGALQVVPADVVVEVQRPEVGGELLRDMVGVAVDLDRVADDVQHRAALDAGADAVILEVDGHRDLDPLAGDEALEIDVLRRIGHRMELHAADQRADRLAAGGDLIQAGLPAGAVQFADHHPGVERDQVGFLLSAIDNRRHLACPPSRPRRPLTASRAYLGLDCNNVGHSMLLNDKRRPPGVPARGAFSPGRGWGQGLWRTQLGTSV